MDTSNTIKVIADNGGGITLSIISTVTGYKYVHYCEDVNQAARDLILAMAGGECEEWENNEVNTVCDEPSDWDDWLEVDSFSNLMAWGVNHPFYNVEQLTNIIDAQVSE